MLAGRRKIFALLFLFGVVLIFAAPASLLSPFLAPEKARFSYQKIDGTIWNGRVTQAKIENLDLGDIKFQWNLLGLLTGTLLADLELTGGDLVGQGQIGASFPNIIVMRDGVFTASLSKPMHRYRLFGSAIEGHAMVDIEYLKISRAGCQRAVGRLETDFLRRTKSFAGIGLENLAGPIRCVDDGTLEIALDGSGSAGEFDVVMQVDSQKHYKVDMVFDQADSQTRNVLLQVGFEPGQKGLHYEASGRLKGL